MGDKSEKWLVVRVYYGLINTTREVIRKGLSEGEAREMAARLDSNPGSSSVVYLAEKAK